MDGFAQRLCNGVRPAKLRTVQQSLSLVASTRRSSIAAVSVRMDTMLCSTVSPFTPQSARSRSDAVRCGCASSSSSSHAANLA